ncbi:MAG: class I SAM-dependent methyltransferase [Candidatus Omnitrophica bacterium]|nr:class I SAM-dependent methyltransferase [Candidatus Omnitrophota bacterium]
MATKQYYFDLKGAFRRARQEYDYYTKRPWDLNQVGEFWDTVTDYDEVNDSIYPYYRRFINSYELAIKYLPRDDYGMLDIQARSGHASLFWHKKRKIKTSVCVDFSDYLMSLAEKRLNNSGLQYSLVKVLKFPLPFDDKEFNFVCSYETIEHVCEYHDFVRELSRVMTDDGIMLITCPNVVWEWVHWFCAIININHSEGPHRFLRRKALVKCFEANNLEILEENTTIFLPFNKKFSIKIDKFLEKSLPVIIKRCFGLRRTFVLRKKHGCL